MSYSARERFHIERVKERLNSPDVLEAFHFLMNWAETSQRLFLFPISRGAFSAIHLSTKENARPYADCEFAFKGALSHMRWWFRKPAFDSGLCSDSLIRDSFESETNLTKSEVMVNIPDIIVGESMVRFVEQCLTQPPR